MNRWVFMQRGVMTLVAIPMLFWLTFYSDTFDMMNKAIASAIGLPVLGDGDFYVGVVVNMCCTILVIFILGHVIDVKRLSDWNKDFRWAVGITVASGLFIAALIALLVLIS